MVKFLLVKFIRGVLYSIPTILISFAANYILYQFFNIEISGVYIVTAIISVITTFITLCILSANKKERPYVYEGTYFWENEINQHHYHSRKKVLLSFFPFYIISIILLGLAIGLFPVFVQNTEQSIRDEIVSSLLAGAIYSVGYSLYLIVWCCNATCKHCKNVMTQKCISVTEEETHKEQRNKSETRRETIGKIKSGDRDIAEIKGDVTYHYTENVKVHSWKEHYRCACCGRNSSSRIREEKKE